MKLARGAAAASPLVFALLAALVFGKAQAALITFDLSGAIQTTASLTILDSTGNYSIELGGGEIGTGVITAGYDLYRSPSGLGIDTSAWSLPPGFGADNSLGIETAGPNEMLFISLGANTFDFLSFNVATPLGVSPGWWLNGVEIGSFATGTVNIPGSFAPSSLFTIQSRNTVEGGFVSSLSFETGMPIPSPIPEPETYALLLAGLGLLGFGAARRRAL